MLVCPCMSMQTIALLFLFAELKYCPCQYTSVTPFLVPEQFSTHAASNSVCTITEIQCHILLTLPVRCHKRLCEL